MGKKPAPEEKTQGGARTAFTDEQIAHIKSTILYRDLLPVDEEFSKQYARVRITQ
jgi:hypothetical protein